MPNYPNINKGQVGTANAGVPLTGMKPDMGGNKRNKKRKTKPMNAAVAAFKKQMRVR